MGDGIGDGGDGWDDRRFADAASAKGAADGGHFDDLRMDGRCLNGVRHGIVHPGAGQQLTVGIVAHLFVERPADALHSAALHLTFDRQRVDGAADVLHNRQIEQVDIAGFFIDLDFGDLGAE